MGLGSFERELRWQSHGNDRPAVRYLCLINSTLLKIIYEGGLCVNDRQCSVVSIHSTASVHFSPASAVDLSEQNLFSHFVFFIPEASLWLIMIIIFTLYIFYSEYAWVLFLLSGLLQIKEQTNRSCASYIALQQRGLRSEVFRHQQRSSVPLTAPYEREAKPTGKTSLTLVIILHAYCCLKKVNTLCVRNFPYSTKHLSISC